MSTGTGIHELGQFGDINSNFQTEDLGTAEEEKTTKGKIDADTPMSERRFNLIFGDIIATKEGDETTEDDDPEPEPDEDEDEDDDNDESAESDGDDENGASEDDQSQSVVMNLENSAILLSLCMILRERRKYFETQKNTSNPIQTGNPGDEIISTENAANNTSAVAEPPTVDGNRAPSPRLIKKEPEEEQTHREKTPLPKQEVICLDDDDDDTPAPPIKKTPAARKQATIKSKPIDVEQKIICLSDDEVPTPPAKKRATIKSESVDLDNIPEGPGSPGCPSNKIKVEPDTGLAESDGRDEDPELKRLKEEEDALEAELLAAQRVADLLKERKEKKARVAAMEQAKRGESASRSIQG
ncbi:hypothetical protein G7Y89_g7825 [Cudoniella acicularis]|uniref:Uncharacterized protein n=1 Tax=Cudoniella acicularis TaxID=354080 RepID=A0A8H4W1N9_9HELO|nr:hypothetical protein G7Y89_g7825 [Cudoniella acicularis]